MYCLKGEHREYAYGSFGIARQIGGQKCQHSVTQLALVLRNPTALPHGAPSLFAAAYRKAALEVIEVTL